MPDAAETDDLLVRRVREGDDAAFTEFMGRYKGPVLNFLRRLLGDAAEAEDAAQETFVRAYRALPRFRPQPGARVSTWLFQIARNLALDLLKRRSRRREDPLDEETARGTPARSGVVSEVVASETSRRIAAAVAELPEDQRTAMVLAEYQGMSHAEIAEVMDCSEKSVESRLYRARQFLRTRLADLVG